MKPRVLFSVVILTVLVVAGSRDARAQLAVDLAPYVGYGADVPNQVADPGSMSIGVFAHVIFPLKDRLTLIANPDLEYYLVDADASGAQLDANLLLGIGSYRTLFNPYVGLGLGITRVSGDDVQAHLASGTDLGLNLIAGSAFGAGTVRPFFQFRYTLGKHNLYLDDQLEPGTSGFGAKGGIVFKVK